MHIEEDVCAWEYSEGPPALIKIYYNTFSFTTNVWNDRHVLVDASKDMRQFNTRDFADEIWDHLFQIEGERTDSFRKLWLSLLPTEDNQGV